MKFAELRKYSKMRSQACIPSPRVDELLNLATGEIPRKEYA
jgi:hypothetical protein